MAKTGAPFVGNLPTDASRRVIQVGNSFATQDATASPKTSPLAYSTSVITLTVPDRAVQIVVKPSTAMRIAETVGMSTYDVVAANTVETIPCAGMPNIYIVRDAADGTLNFKFISV
jgi:hypothetical protein